MNTSALARVRAHMTLLLALLLACAPALDSADSARPDAGECPIRYLDRDGDGYGYGGGNYSCGLALDGVVEVGGDCTDNDPAISPAAAEVCDGFDNDCDGGRDEGC